MTARPTAREIARRIGRCLAAHADHLAATSLIAAAVMYSAAARLGEQARHARRSSDSAMPSASCGEEVRRVAAATPALRQEVGSR